MSEILRFALFFFVLGFLISMAARGVNGILRRPYDDDDFTNADYDYDDYDYYDETTEDSGVTVSSPKVEKATRKWLFGAKDTTMNHHSVPLDDAPAEVIDQAARNLKNRDEHIQWWIDSGVHDIENYLAEDSEDED